MSGASSPAVALPLFFKRVVGVNPAMHAGLRLDRSTGLGFAAAAQSVPLGLGEIEAAAQHYPVLFTSGPTPTPVALLGLREGSNLFLRPDGSWQSDAYVPAYVRAFPFIFLKIPPARRSTSAWSRMRPACAPMPASRCSRTGGPARH
jgi:hypothetical protein